LENADLLKTLVDRRAITDLIYRYCRSMDRIDPELGHTIFHADATADYGAEIFQGSGCGAIDHICAVHRHAQVHTHQVTNILLELNGDHAASESYYVSALRMVINDQLMQFTTWGRYLDKWSRRDGRWGINHRVAMRDLDEINEARPMSQLDRGRRDNTDPSYALFNEVRQRR